MKRLDHFTIACLTFVAMGMLAAIVILVDTHHSADVRAAIISVSSFVGSVITLAGIQSVRNGVGRANNSIENGVMKDQIRNAVKEVLAERAANMPQDRAADKNTPTP